MTTTEIENFPGFIDIAGPDLMDRMRAQAEKWGSELLTEDVESVDLSSRPFTIKGTETTVKANTKQPVVHNKLELNSASTT